MKTRENLEHKKYPLRKVTLGLAATAALLASCSPSSEDIGKKPHETVQVQEQPSPDTEANETPEVENDGQSHSTIDVYMRDETHFNAEVIINPEDSNIGVPVEGNGQVRLDPNSDEQLYQSVAFADIVSDDDFTVDVTGFKIGDRVLDTKKYEGIVKINAENNHYQIALVHPEQFKPEGPINVSLEGETAKPNAMIDGGVNFSLLKVQDAAKFLP